jgi:arylsulfatase A-like enzyme
VFAAPVPGSASRSAGPRRRSSRTHLPALVAFVLVAGAGCGERQADAPVPERILLVTIDTLRADHVGCYGAENAATRTLDTLAAAGVRFDAAVSPAPLTLPAHASLMTALDPPGHGVRHNGIFRLPDAVPTLAERLRESGFATGAVVGSQVLARRYGLQRGFDFYDDQPTDRVAGGSGWPERRADQVVDAALALAGRLGARFFLWVHFYDPHMTYDPPAGFASAFSSRPYDGEIAFVDAQLGRLLEGLRAGGKAAGLLAVVTSDHGESFGEHGDRAHSYLVYETTQRIPLLFAGPGIPAGRSVAAPVGLVDVAPTVIALARAKPLPETAGRDLSPLFDGAPGAPENAYFETLAPQLDFGWSPLLGLRAGSLKYIRAPRPELYDLAADPGEQRSLAGERPELVASLDAALEARLRASPSRAATPVAPSRSDREALARLGYLPSQAVAELGVVGGPDPKDRLEVIAEVGRAQVAIAEGRAEEALALLRALGDAGPSVAGLRAAAAVNAGEPAAAEQDARAALKASPGRDDYVSVLALALDAQGRGDEAVAELRKLPADLPLSAEVALRLAAAETPDSGGGIGLQRIERALELTPGDAQLLLARDLLAAERAGEPRDGDALRAHLHYLRARVLFDSGRREESRRALDQALASPAGESADWRAAAESLRKQLDSAGLPQGARGKDFSSISGKPFPPGSRGLRSGLSRNLESLVKSNTWEKGTPPLCLAPELQSQTRPNVSRCRGLS